MAFAPSVLVHITGRSATTNALAVFFALEGFTTSHSESLEKALLAIRHAHIDIFLLDTDMLEGGGFSLAEAIEKVREGSRSASLIVACREAERSAAIAIADEIVVKPFDSYHLLVAVVGVLRTQLTNRGSRSIATGLSKGSPTVTASLRQALSARQLEIVNLLSSGLSNKRIATTLGISPRTVDNHRYDIMRRLGARNSVDLGRIVGELTTRETSKANSSD